MELYPTDRKVLEWLRKHCVSGEPCEIDISKMMSDLEVARTTVYRALRTLAGYGFITIVKGEGGRRTVYLTEETSMEKMDVLAEFEKAAAPLRKFLGDLQAYVSRQAALVDRLKRENEDLMERLRLLESEYNKVRSVVEQLKHL